MAEGRQYGAAIFSPGLSEVLLVKRADGDQGASWSFPFGPTSETVHIAAAADALQQQLGLDITDKITRNWVEVELPQGDVVRLYVALGVHPSATGPDSLRCCEGVTAQWHPLQRILPPIDAVLAPTRATPSPQRQRQQPPAQGEPDAAPAGEGAAAEGGAEVGAGGEAEAAAAAGGGSSAGSDGGAVGGAEGGGEAGEEELLLALEPGIAPFLAKLKSLLNRHPEWRIAQLDPHLLRLFQAAVTPPHHHQHTASHLRRQQGQGQGAAGEATQDGEQAAARDAGGEAGGGEAAGGRGEAGDGAAGGGEAPGPAEPSGRTEQVEGEEADAAAAGPAAAGAAGAEAEDEGGAQADAEGPGGGEEGEGGMWGAWRGPRPQEHLEEYCRRAELPAPCYSLVVKKSARRPLVTASCILPHLGVQVTPDMHVHGGMAAACQAAALAAILWLEGALPPDGGEAVRVVPVGWPPLLTEARGESYEAAQQARRAGGARRELDPAQREALLREMDKKRQRLVAEAAELERLMAALRGGDAEADLPDIPWDRLQIQVQLPPLERLGVGSGDGGGGGGGRGGRGGGLSVSSSGVLGEREGDRGAAGGGGADASAGGLAKSVTQGLQALQFCSGGPAGSSGAGKGTARPPGTKRPREDAASAGASPNGPPAKQQPEGTKNVVMELKELCDRKRWPQPQYCYTLLSGGAGGAAHAGRATAVVTLPTVAELGEVSSGVQTNKKRAKEAAAAMALAQLSALGLK